MASGRPSFKPERPGHFIREWRKHRGLTLEELAEAVGATHGALSQLERGLVNYTQPMLEAVAAALRCTPADLVIRDPNDDTSAWRIHDRLKGAPPETAKKALELLETFLKAG